MFRGFYLPSLHSVSLCALQQMAPKFKSVKKLQSFKLGGYFQIPTLYLRTTLIWYESLSKFKCIHFPQGSIFHVSSQKNTRSFWMHWTTLPTKIIHPRYYICTERFFASPQFVFNKLFLNKLLKKLVAYIFALLFGPFASKLVNYSRRSESLNIRKKSKSATFSFENKHSSKAHCDWNYWPIWTLKVA